MDPSSTPAFPIFVATTIVLGFNLMGVWGYSGVVRSKTKSAVNKEDAKQFGVSLVERDPPEVARVLRAHANAQAAIVPFLFLALIFALAGGSARTALITFGIFTAARLAHTVIYLAGKQPLRTVVFIVGGLATLALAVEDVVLLVSGPSR